MLHFGVTLDSRWLSLRPLGSLWNRFDFLLVRFCCPWAHFSCPWSYLWTPWGSTFSLLGPPRAIFHFFDFFQRNFHFFVYFRWNFHFLEYFQWNLTQKPLPLPTPFMPQVQAEHLSTDTSLHGKEAVWVSKASGYRRRVTILSSITSSEVWSAGRRKGPPHERKRMARRWRRFHQSAERVLFEQGLGSPGDRCEVFYREPWRTRVLLESYDLRIFTHFEKDVFPLFFGIDFIVFSSKFLISLASIF